jgi:hypothetical protein
MVRQGSFAQTSRIKKSHELKNRQVIANNQTITWEDLSDFVIVRYQLTMAQAKPKVVTETVRRFLAVLLDNLQPERSVNLSEQLKMTLPQIGTQVPWQFYAVLAGEWAQLEKFLKKELPAAPLEQRLIVIQDKIDSAPIIAQHLALTWFMATYKGDIGRLSRVSDEQVNAMTASFVQSDELNLQNIAMVYSSVPPVSREGLDDQTKAWFEALEKIVIK